MFSQLSGRESSGTRKNSQNPEEKGIRNPRWESLIIHAGTVRSDQEKNNHFVGGVTKKLPFQRSRTPLVTDPRKIFSSLLF